MTQRSDKGQKQEQGHEESRFPEKRQEAADSTPAPYAVVWKDGKEYLLF